MPAVLAEVRGRLTGGDVLLDLGNRSRRRWLIGAGALVLAAIGCFALLGVRVPGGGSFGALLLIAAVALGLLGLRRGQVRRSGIVRPGFPGYLPLGRIGDWSREGDRLEVRLRRAVLGRHKGVVRMRAAPRVAEAASGLLRRLIGDPVPVRPRARWDPPGSLTTLIFVFCFLGGSNYIDRIPKERPPGRVGFRVAGEPVLRIGEEGEVRLRPMRFVESTGEWEGLDPRCFDLSRERIDLVLHTRNAEDREVRTVSHVRGPCRGHMLRAPCRVPPDARPGEALIVVVFIDADGRAHEPDEVIVRLQ